MIREEVAIEDTFARSIVVNAPNGKNTVSSIYQASMQILKMIKEEMLLMILKMKSSSLKLKISKELFLT
jgi:hypothetical protein